MYSYSSRLCARLQNAGPHWTRATWNWWSRRAVFCSPPPVRIRAPRRVSFGAWSLRSCRACRHSPLRSPLPAIVSNRRASCFQQLHPAGCSPASPAEQSHEQFSTGLVHYAYDYILVLYWVPISRNQNQRTFSSCSMRFSLLLASLLVCWATEYILYCVY